MPTTYLNKRRGGGQNNPTVQEMLSALTELEKSDPEHPDCWLSDEAGWTVAAYESGMVVLENVESGEGPWHISKIDRQFVFQLWQALQRGDLAAVRGQTWQEGYES